MQNGAKVALKLYSLHSYEFKEIFLSLNLLQSEIFGNNPWKKCSYATSERLWPYSGNTVKGKVVKGHNKWRQFLHTSLRDWYLTVHGTTQWHTLVRMTSLLTHTVMLPGISLGPKPTTSPLKSFEVLRLVE